MAQQPSLSTAEIVPAPALAGTAQPAAPALSSSAQSIRLARFDRESEDEWSALVRDILALANSGGGQIAIGDRLDAADVHDHLRRYTDGAFAEVSLRIGEGDGAVATIEVGPAVFPVAFTPRDGGLPGADSAGLSTSAPAFYFRHGERTEPTEPGTTADMRSFVERLLRRVRRRWLRGIRRLLSRPMTFDADLAPKAMRRGRIRLERTVLQPVRIVSDPNAPALQPQDVERLYPWRQKDLLRALNARLGGSALNSYDIQAVRRHHRLDERPEFVFNLPGAGRRYSPAVADWIVEQHERHPEFFHEARAADQAMLRLRRKKPR
jgi:hypothetical protein